MNNLDEKLNKVSVSHEAKGKTDPEERALKNQVYQRDILPDKQVLSANDLAEFCEILIEVNEHAKQIQFNSLNLSDFESPEQAKGRLDEVMLIEHSYRDQHKASIKGPGVPNTSHRSFPDNLKSIFISNVTYAKDKFNFVPANTVEVFLDFERPSLKIDLQTLPSNPTQNGSVINVAGRDENWVISTEQKIKEFLDGHTASRPFIHGAGAYDYIVYLVFFPALIFLIYKNSQPFNPWLEQQTVFLNVILGTYFLLIALFLVRFIFQYVRWLFPPMEYYKRSKFGAFVHRGVAAFIASGILISAVYDLIKSTVKWF